MNKSYNITYRNLWRNVQSSKRPFLVSHWRLKNNLIWKVVLVSNISRTESDLYNIFAFLSFCFSAIWWTDQPMPKKQWFPWFFQILAKIQWKWSFSTLKVLRKLTFKFKMLFCYNQFDKMFVCKIFQRISTFKISIWLTFFCNGWNLLSFNHIAGDLALAGRVL